MKKILLAKCVFLGFFVLPVYASDNVKPSNLRSVMQQLATNMQEATQAIVLEDWEQVEALAIQISSHDKPTMSEKIRILTWLGSSAPEFRKYDKQVKLAAEQMQQAAKNKQANEVIVKFADIQKGCLACHESYRQSFIRHFY